MPLSARQQQQRIDQLREMGVLRQGLFQRDLLPHLLAVAEPELGGGAQDQANGIALDSSGDAYVVGWTQSPDFPVVSPLWSTNRGGQDAFVSKLNPTGTALVYSTYLGGSDQDAAQGVAVDATGSAYVTGYTYSTDFPIVNGQAPSNSGAAAFVSKFNPTGSALAYSTALEGSASAAGAGIGVDSAGNVYLDGSVYGSGFPTKNPFQGYAGGEDAFVAKLGPPNCMAGTAPAGSGTIPWHPHYQARLTSLMGLSVDLADGHADLDASDLQVAGRGLDLKVHHTWDSTLAESCAASSVGMGWQSNLTQKMSGAPGSTVTYTDAAGTRWTFPYVSGVYQIPAGMPWGSLIANTGGYTLTNILTSEALGFDNQGRYRSDTDAYTNHNTLTQSGSGAPTREANSGGHALVMSYFNGLLNDVQSPIYQSGGPTAQDGQHVAYGYDGQELTGIAWAANSLDPQTHNTDQQAAYFGYMGDLVTSITTPMTMSGALAVTRVWTLAYDASNRLISVTSPISGSVGQAGYTPAYTTHITYNAGSTVVTAGYGTPNAISTTYTLDGSGRATVVTDGLGHTQHYSYDSDNDILTSEDGNNNTTTYHYQYIGPNNADGQVIEVDKPAIHPNYPTSTLTAPVTHAIYNATTHDLVEAYDNYGAYSFYGYNSHHDIISTAVLTGTTTVGGTTTYHWRGEIRNYDSSGELTGQIDGRGVTVPDTTSLTTTPTVSANGSASSYTHSWTYDAQGNQTSSSTPSITTTQNGTPHTGPAITQYSYDGDGNLRYEQSANNYVAGHPTTNATIYGYDHLGRQNSVRQPPIPVTPASLSPVAPLSETKFDGDGNSITQEDGNVDKTISAYDPLGRVTETDQQLSLRGATTPMTATTIITYTATGRSAMQDPQGNVTTYSYDAANRLTGVVDAAGEQQTYGYDNADNRTSTTIGNPSNPSSTIAVAYDALNEPTSSTVNGPGLSGALTTTYSYDLDGHLVRQVDPNNDTSFATYDPANQLVSQELDPNAPNLPTGAHRETFAYDAAGNLISSTDFRGGVTTMGVDGDNRQTGQSDSYTSVPTISTSAQFDPDGNLVGQTQTIGGQTHSFGQSLNPADWPTSATNDSLSTVTTGDAVADPLSQTIQNGAGTVFYNVNAAGSDNLIGVQSVGSTTPLTTTFGFNNNEQMTGEALPSSVEQDAGYDKANRLSQLTAQNTANHALLNNNYQYGYDPLGLTNAITTTVQGSPSTQTLTHDAAGWLVAASGGGDTDSWSYDGRGNLTDHQHDGADTSYIYNSGNPEEVGLLNVNGLLTAYSYDGDGNPTSISNGGDYVRGLSYDAQARLTQITLGSPVTETITLSYNAFGQRASYMVTQNNQTTLAESFKYQGDQLSQVAYTGTSITTPYTDTYIYTQDGNPLELLRQQQGASTATPYWYVVDGQGNVVALTNQSGSVVASYRYDQWGRPISISEPTVHQQLRYAGYWYDNELGWYWLSVRYYDPVLERFLQPDPSGTEGLFSYVYGGDNPSDQADPSGLSPAPPPLDCLVKDPDTGTELLTCGSAAYGQALGNGALAFTALDGSFFPSIPWQCALALPGGPIAVALCVLSNHYHWRILQHFRDLLVGAYNLVAGNDIRTLTDAHASGADKFLAVVDLASNALVIVPIFGEDAEAAKVAADLAEADLKAADAGLKATNIEAEQLTYNEALELSIEKGATCGCFPGSTGVMTPHGLVVITSLHIGDAILAEDPTTGKVEPEKVQAVIDDGIKPLMQVGMSDGSSLLVTTNHLFYVDSGSGIALPQWVQAGNLRIGDRVRTEGGKDVAVTTLRYRMGQAPVYTLTVANDHDFFVGSAQVLVHNTNGCLEGVRELQVFDPADPGRTITDIDLISGDTLWEEKTITSAVNQKTGKDLTAKWVQNNVVGKFQAYLEARQYLPGYEDAAIGFNFIKPGVDPALKAAIETAVDSLRAANPGVTILLKWTE